jgi:hypothetical protein
MGNIVSLGRWMWVVVICEDNSRELVKVYVVGEEEWVNVGLYKAYRGHLFNDKEECLNNEIRLLKDWEENFGVDKGYREVVKRLLDENR